jgi:hypothetical protein
MQGVAQLGQCGLLGKVALQEVDVVEAGHFQQIDADDMPLAFHAFQRHLAPSAWRAAQIDHHAVPGRNKWSRSSISINL